MKKEQTREKITKQIDKVEKKTKVENESVKNERVIKEKRNKKIEKKSWTAERLHLKNNYRNKMNEKEEDFCQTGEKKLRESKK